MNHTRLYFLLTFLPFFAQAQQKPFSIGVGLVATQDNYSFNDPGQRLLTGFFDESHIRRSIFGRWTPSARWSTEVGQHQGFGTTIRSDVEYVSSFEPGITNRATITSNGSGMSSGLSIAYMFGRRALDNVPDTSTSSL